MAAENGCISADSKVRFRPCKRRQEEVSRMISNLEDDLLIEILIHLPDPRYSCRCKSVCKRWNSLISSPYFNRRFVSHHHRSTNEQAPSMFFTNHYPQPLIDSVLPADIPITDEEGRHRFLIWDSFKDLVLCGYTDPNYRDSELGRSYIICNPSTKQWIALPLAPRKPTRYAAASGRLVVRPCISTSVELDLGDGQSFVYSSEYCFKVVCLYKEDSTVRVDLFCSESREWRKNAIVLEDTYGLFDTKLHSYNDKLFCWYFKHHVHRTRYLLAMIDPFRPDLPPTQYVDASVMPEKLEFWKFIIVQGALHVIVLDRDASPGWLTVWRLEEEDGKSWRKLYEGLINRTSSSSRGCDYELGGFGLAGLHPEKPKTVLLEYWDSSGGSRNGIYSCDFTSGRGELLEFFAEIRERLPRWKLVDARVSCWPTPIPRYKELRGMYDGSYKCLFQRSEATTTLHWLMTIDFPVDESQDIGSILWCEGVEWLVLPDALTVIYPNNDLLTEVGAADARPCHTTMTLVLTCL